MTNNTDTTTQNTETVVIVRPVTDKQRQILAEVTEQFEQVNTDVEFNIIEIEKTGWKWDSPCPNCGSKHFNEIRGREERSTYNANTKTVEYKGKTTRTAEIQTNVIAVICEECSEILWETLAHNTLSYQTL